MSHSPVKKASPTKNVIKKKPVPHSAHHHNYGRNLPGRVAGLATMSNVMGRAGGGMGGAAAGILAGDVVRKGVNKITHHL